MFVCLFYNSHVSLKNLLTKKNYMDIVLLLSVRVFFFVVVVYCNLYLILFSE